MPIAQLRPIKSNKAITGAPVFEPLTGLPGDGKPIATNLVASYTMRSNKTNNHLREIAFFVKAFSNIHLPQNPPLGETFRL
jgi:hypothetical protein